MPPHPILSSHQKDGVSRSKPSAIQRQKKAIIITTLLIVLGLFLWCTPSKIVPSGNANELEYSIVFDAGSTGSRVHVYSFSRGKNGELLLENDDFHQLKPGLSAYAGKPDAAAESLAPLLSAIKDSTPSSLISRTPCQLKATAGLRLLPGSQADDIIKAVQTKLESTDYVVASDAVAILDGDYEGAYAWLTVNYLLQRLDGSEETVTTIDLGGGSVQESYELIYKSSQVIKNDEVYVHHSHTSSHVYVHSYLNYGLMAARALILESTGETKDNPCVALGYNGIYHYKGKDITVRNNASVADHARCKEVIRHVLNLNQPCGAPIDECTFDGVWGGPVARQKNTRSFYLFSYIWDRAIDVGIVTSQTASGWETSVEQFLIHANDVCGDSKEQLKSRFPDVDDKDLPFLCMDVSYIYLLLMEGLKIDPYQSVYLTKQIDYRGKKIEISWTLGAAIDNMAKTSN